MKTSYLILASSSPRRAHLLSLLGVPFEVVVPDIPEIFNAGETPEEHVVRLAREKAAAICPSYPGKIVIAADTAVVLNGRVFGKPTDNRDARRMLEKLQGQTHHVFTGYALANGIGFTCGLEISEVIIKSLSGEEIEAYLSIGEHKDKAGAYAAQGEGSRIIEKIVGSYTNVVGLPIMPIIPFLQKRGFHPVDPGLD